MNRNQRGMTLVEMMMSFGLLALVVLSNYFVLMQAQYMSIDSRRKLIALNAARTALEVVKDTPYGSVAALSFTPYVPADLPNAAITMQRNAVNPNSTITINVTYLGAKNIPKTVSLTTMKSLYG